MEQSQVKKIAQEVLRRLAHKVGHGGPRLVALFCGGLLNYQEAAGQLQVLRLKGWEIVVGFSPAAQWVTGAEVLGRDLAPARIYTPEKPLPLDVLREAQVIAVPVLTMNSAGKIATGIMDTPVTQGVADGLMLGKPVIAACDAANPHEPQRAALGLGKAPAGWAEMKERQLLSLSGLGVRLVGAGALAQEIEQAAAFDAGGADGSAGVDRVSEYITRGLVTRATVLEAWGEGAQVVRVQGGPVSPLAREAASEYDLRLVED